MGGSFSVSGEEDIGRGWNMYRRGEWVRVLELEQDVVVRA